MFPNILLRSHPTGWAAGFFDSTFGNIWGVVDKLAASGKCPLIRINGPWTNHAYVPAQHDAAIFAALAKTQLMANRYLNLGVRWQFAPICENDNTTAAYRSLIDTCKQRCLSVQIINSRGTKGADIPGTVSEVHGSTKAPNGDYQYSYDGTSVVDANVRKDLETHARADTFFFWHPSFNLKYKAQLSADGHEPLHVKKNDSAPPKERNCKPTKELIESIARLGESINGSPKIGRRDLWKSHSDRNNTPPAEREYKPVFITPTSVAKIELRDGGKVIAVSKARAKYLDDRFIYRFDKFGYQMADKVVDIFAGGKKIGEVNPAFREGVSR